MKLFYFILFLLNTLLLSNECLGQKPGSDLEYTFKRGDFNGIGKWYMGREISYVMGFEGISWLERFDREKEENVSTCILVLRSWGIIFWPKMGFEAKYSTKMKMCQKWTW